MAGSIAERFAQVLGRVAERLRIPGEDATLKLARRFGISGFVARQLSDLGYPVDYDEEVRGRRLFELALQQKASELSSTLTAEGVPHCFVRGVAVARWLYGPGERFFVDVDLCVPHKVRSKALETLQTIGYRKLPPNNQSGPDEMRPGVILVRGTASTPLLAANIEVTWGVERVDRLLPHADTPFPEIFWQRIEPVNSLPVPAAEHHAALIMHHLVHHDLLHVRGLLDFALLWQRLSPDADQEFQDAARTLGVLRAARAVSAALQQDLGLDPRPGIGPAATDWRGRRIARLLDLERWLTWAGAASIHEHKSITPRRFARRLLLIDHLGSAGHMLVEGLWPPREFLRWRWPELKSQPAARARHLLAVTAKVFGVTRGG